jgi:hypothetical protein
MLAMLLSSIIAFAGLLAAGSILATRNHYAAAWQALGAEIRERQPMRDLAITVYVPEFATRTIIYRPKFTARAKRLPLQPALCDAA